MKIEYTVAIDLIEFFIYPVPQMSYWKIYVVKGITKKGINSAELATVWSEVIPVSNVLWGKGHTKNNSYCDFNFHNFLVIPIFSKSFIIPIEGNFMRQKGLTN